LDGEVNDTKQAPRKTKCGESSFTGAIMRILRFSTLIVPMP
jgi:hypothetical protein